jgi:signal transduction histidine kinase
MSARPPFRGHKAIHAPETGDSRQPVVLETLGVVEPTAESSELGGVEFGLQRASGLGLAAFEGQAVAVAIAGAALYPPWWFAFVAPVVAVATTHTVVRCFQGRSGTLGRLVTALVVSAANVVTAIATAESVREVGNAMSPVVTATVILLGLFDHPAVALPVGSLVIATQIGSVAITRSLGVEDLVVVTAIQVAVMLAAALAGGAVRHLARDQDDAQARLAEAVLTDRVHAATCADRREQDRELHDTVLSTLTSLARSSLVDDDGLRARCAADAAYLRSSAPDDPDRRSSDSELRRGLEMMSETQSTPGFFVRIGVSGRCHDLPAAVVHAIIRATREAVTNASRHSGAAGVEVRADFGPRRVRIDVVDHGCGRSPSAGHGGLGVRWSIIERMEEVGGAATVEYRPGKGTQVALTWPR